MITEHPDRLYPDWGVGYENYSYDKKEIVRKCLLDFLDEFEDQETGYYKNYFQMEELATKYHCHFSDFVYSFNDLKIAKGVSVSEESKRRFLKLTIKLHEIYFRKYFDYNRIGNDIVESVFTDKFIDELGEEG